MAITTKNRKQLQAYFVKNAIPTEGNFRDLIDAQLNQAEDGIFRLPGEALSVVAAAGDQRRALRLYGTYPAPNPDWQISLSPAQRPGDPATARVGFGVADGAGNTRLFIDAASGHVGLGTNNPSDRLTVSGGDLRVEGDGYHRLKVLAVNAGIELVARNDGGTPHIDFTQGILDNPDFGVRLIATGNRVLHLQSGLGPATLRIQGALTVDAAAQVGGALSVGGPINAPSGVLVTGGVAHIEADGALYRNSDGQVYLTVDDNLFIRDQGAQTWAAQFDTNGGNLNLQGRLSALTGVAIGTREAGGGALDVRVPGAGGWDRFVVTASDAWNNGNKHVTIGAGGAAGIMINNPHVSWYAAEKRASIRYGISLPNQKWWDVGLREDDTFSLNHCDGAQVLVAAGSGDVTVHRNLSIGGALTTGGQVNAAGGLSVLGAVAHIEADGALYRNTDGQVYLTVDDNLFIRDQGAKTWAAQFETDQGNLNLQGRLSALTGVAIGTREAGGGPLDVRVPGAGGWDRFVVTASDAWGNGNKHVTIGAGGAGGIMINNPHVSWYAAEKRASIRYGQSRPNNHWWDVGVREDGSFSLVHNSGNTTLRTDVAGDTSILRNLILGGQQNKLDVQEQGAAILRAADLLFGHSGRRGAPGRAIVDNKDSLVLNFAADWPRTDVHGPLAVSGEVTINAPLTVNGSASLGYAQPIGDLSQALRSGFYQADNPAARVPDVAHSWVHMIAVRHANAANHHQLQIASSYAENDKLYFRKIARDLGAAVDVRWNELATVTGGVFRLGNWVLTATNEHLTLQCGDRIVARFSTTWDRLQIFRNADGKSPYFYFNANANFGIA